MRIGIGAAAFHGAFVGALSGIGRQAGGALVALTAAVWLGTGSLAAQDATPPAPEGAATAQAPATTGAPPRGSVTNLPLPRYVTLKGIEGNARRGPGMSHRIDWVFTRAGMPLRVTAEFEHWRRVEDMEGAGGWVHYSLLSGVRNVIVTEDMVQFRSLPDDKGQVVLQAETGVIARVLECRPDWCRLRTDAGRGWVRKSALWGVDPAEIVE